MKPANVYQGGNGQREISTKTVTEISKWTKSVNTAMNSNKYSSESAGGFTPINWNKKNK